MATLIAPETVAASTRAFPAQTDRAWGRPRRARHEVGHLELTGQFRIDLRDQAPDLFEDVSVMDWSTLTWRDVGRPHRTEKWSSARRSSEQEHQQPLPIIDGWRLFNTAFHQLFLTDVPEAQRQAKTQFGEALSRLDLHEAKDALQDIAYLAVWNKIMRVEDAVWDPRGKRALFAGLDVNKPRILFLGVDPTIGHQRVWYRDEMPIHFEFADIRDLQYGREFDVVVSIGLLEHFPDAHTAECLEMHRRFLKPGGTVVMTTPRNQVKSRVCYNLMADWMNHGYRELMDVRQMGLYCHENGFAIRRAGVIKAHNGLVMTLR